MSRISAAVKNENEQTKPLDILSSFRMRILRTYIVSFRFDYFREVEKRFNLPYGTFYTLYITFTALKDFLSRLGFIEDMYDNVIRVQSMFSEFPEVAYVLAKLFVSYIVVRRYHERYRLPLDIITYLFNGERTSINEVSTVVDEILDRIRKNRLSISKEEIVDCVRTVRLSHMLRFLARLVERYGEDLLLLIIKLVQPPAIGDRFNESILPRLDRLNIISSRGVKTDKKLLNYLLNTVIDNATAVEEARIGIQALERYLPVIEEKVSHLIDHIDNHVSLPRATMPPVKEHFNIIDTYLRRIFTEYAAYYNRFAELAERIINMAYTVVSKLTENGELCLEGRVSRYYSFKNLLTVEEIHNRYIKLSLLPNLRFTLSSDEFLLSNDMSDPFPAVLISCLELLYNIDTLLRELEPCQGVGRSSSVNRFIEFLAKSF